MIKGQSEDEPIKKDKIREMKVNTNMCQFLYKEFKGVCLYPSRILNDLDKSSRQLSVPALNIQPYMDEVNLDKSKFLLRKKFMNIKTESLPYEENEKSEVKETSEKLKASIEKLYQLSRMIRANNFDQKMKNEKEFLLFILNHPLLKYTEEYPSILKKYNKIKHENLKQEFMDNTGYTHSNLNTISQSDQFYLPSDSDAFDYEDRFENDEDDSDDVE